MQLRHQVTLLAAGIYRRQLLQLSAHSGWDWEMGWQHKAPCNSSSRKLSAPGSWPASGAEALPRAPDHNL